MQLKKGAEFFKANLLCYILSLSLGFVAVILPVTTM